MIDIVINFDQENQGFKVYEPTTDTIIISKNLTEAFVNLSMFLTSENLITGDILESSDINYHLDSMTVKNMIESNVNLLKRLRSAPSGFMLSSQKFGGSNSSIKKPNKGFNNTEFNKSYKKESSSKHFSNSKSTSFSKSNFKSANKKFGNM